MSEDTKRRSRGKVEYDIEIGIARPPRVRDSIYPWDEMREAAIDQAGGENPEQLVSFFVPCDDEEHASSSRTSIQTSGRTYYQKRRQNHTVASSIMQEEDTWGVRNWVFAYTPDEEETVEEPGEGQAD